MDRGRPGRVEKGKEGGGPKGSFGSDLIRVFHDERRERGRRSGLRWNNDWDDLSWILRDSFLMSYSAYRIL